MRVLVTGARGQLGKDVMRELEKRGHVGLGIDMEDADISQIEEVRRIFDEKKPDAVIHCAAYTAVDLAETNREVCFAANVTGSKNVAIAAKECDASILAISTDYVFGGEGSNFYNPDDPKDPQNYYGETKLLGEEEVKKANNRYFIVRTSWVFGEDGKNFVKTIHRLGEEKDFLRVVEDEVGSPTYTKDLSRLVVDMIETEKYGTYHATNEGVCTRYEFALEILKRFQVTCKVEPCSHDAFPTPAKRPHNSRLSKDCLEAAGFKRLPDWKDALNRFER